jgi:hypothetical protein
MALAPQVIIGIVSLLVNTVISSIGIWQNHRMHVLALKKDTDDVV